MPRPYVVNRYLKCRRGQACLTPTHMTTNVSDYPWVTRPSSITAVIAPSKASSDWSISASA